MNTWKVTIEHKGITVEITIKATTFSDAFTQAGLEYPNCKVIHLKKETKDTRKQF